MLYPEPANASFLPKSITAPSWTGGGAPAPPWVRLERPARSAYLPVRIEDVRRTHLRISVPPDAVQRLRDVLTKSNPSEAELVAAFTPALLKLEPAGLLPTSR
jgi:hypothetical protein